MSCASCVASVERTLQGVSGVSYVSVNFAAETAFVRTTSTPDALLSALAASGYNGIVADESDAGRQAEQIHNIRQSIIKAALALVAGGVLMAAMRTHSLPDITHQPVWLLVGLLTACIMAISGRHFFINALRSARYLSSTMDTLIALGTGAAFSYSLWVVLLPETVPENARFLFFEAALFVIGFVNLGKSLELHARAKSSSAIQDLLALKPIRVSRIKGGETASIALSAVGVGDLLLVRPGDTVPVDGVIIDGATSIDESMLTGEAAPVERTAGEKVVSGTLNQFGSFTLRAEQVGTETILAKLIELVKQAQNSKPPIARLTDSISAIFVPSVMIIALLTGIYWGSNEGLSVALVTSVSVLVIACPCALGLAIPMSVMVGMGRAAKHGLIIKNSDVLQSAANIDVMVLDKTGTLTQGKPSLAATGVSNGCDLTEHRLLQYAASLEFYSDHPLGQAVSDYANERGITRLAVKDVQAHPGGGICGSLGNSTLHLGSAKYLAGKGIQVTSEQTGTRIYVALDRQYVGWIRLEDTLREGAGAVIRALKQQGICVYLLSGDTQAATRAVANQLGISQYRGGVSPQDKLDAITALQSGGSGVAMVGDGINDAPALCAANVGIAMGCGTDIAIEGADMTIVGNQLARLPACIKISRQTMFNIYQNLAAAFIYNIVLIPVAAGVLYPTLINPAFAGLAMALSSVSVVLNANRMRWSSF